MPDDLQNDPLLQALAGLPGRDLDRARAARLRTRCHSVLERRHRHQAAAKFRASQLFRGVLEPALIGGAGAVYLVEVLRRAAALFGP